MNTGALPFNVLPELRGRVSSLDGLRAVSIAMVLFSHVQRACGFPLVPSWLTWLFNGPLGVRIFFVISGFIITLLLLKEEQKYGSFSIGSFYLRRIFRILPVYYLFIVTVIVIDRLVNIDLTFAEVVHAFTFTTGWQNGSTWMLGHTWSLSVEEQFYLLWPITLLLVKSQRNRIILVLICVALYPVMRILVYISPLSANRSYLFITQGDAILFGCLLALVLFYHGSLIARYFRERVVLMRLLCIFLVGLSNALQSNAILGMITIPLSNTVEGICIAWLIASFIFNKDVIYQFINSRVMIFLGLISYSWYLWQQLFLFECGRYFNGLLFSFPFNIILSFIAAVGSYYLIERNFEHWKRKLMERSTPGQSNN